MTRGVVFRRDARREIEHAALWYHRQRRGLGLQFLQEIDRAIELAVEMPLRFPIVHPGVRRVRTRRFPYSVFFRDESDRIVVLAVMHGRRDPAVARSRR